MVAKDKPEQTGKRLKFDLFFGEVQPSTTPKRVFMFTRAHIEVSEGGLPEVCLARVAPKQECTFRLDMMNDHDGHAPGWGEDGPPGKTLADLDGYKERIFGQIQSQLPGNLVVLITPEKFEQGWTKVATYDGPAPEGEADVQLPEMPPPGFAQDDGKGGPAMHGPSIPPSAN